MSQVIEVAVPDIGDFKDVEVIEVLVKVGDTVGVEQSLITVESDKASMEIPSSAAGVVAEVVVKLGQKVSQGTPLVRLAAQAGAPAAAPASAPSPAAAATTGGGAPASAPAAITAPAAASYTGT
ncbi:MAG: dihydrolipoyllysine-residue acetyltransferase component of pyruvate dehydrogenase complex, partial [Pseudomonadota bacterium]